MAILYIVMPAYNEAETITAVVEKWYPLLLSEDPASRLLIADSGSTDGTHERLQTLQAGRYPKLRILEGTAREHGPKLMALYREALRNGADLIFQTDSDNQTDPADYPAFRTAIEGSSAVIGVRRQRGDGAWRRFVEAVVCCLLRLYFGVRVPDANAPFRLMRREALERYLPLLPPDYALPNIMLTAFFVRGGEIVDFRDITFRMRQSGRSSLNIRRMIGIGCRSLRDFARFRRKIKRFPFEQRL